MKRNKIVVCGATGNQGGAVAAALLKNGGWQVTALTRDPASPAARALSDQGAEVVKADLLDLNSLLGAFKDAYGVFSITQPWSYDLERFDTDAEIRQAKNIIWACIETGIQQVVYSSILNVTGGNSGVGYIDSKILLEGLFTRHLPYRTIVRPALYMENVGTRLLDISGDRIRGRFDSNTWIPFVALSDIGSSVADIFGSQNKFEGSEIILAGDLSSGNELAVTLSGVANGLKFRYHPANELFLRLFKPRAYRMRKFFERQGSMLHKNNGSMILFPRLPSDPLAMDDFIKANAVRLLGGKAHS